MIGITSSGYVQQLVAALPIIRVNDCSVSTGRVDHSCANKWTQVLDYLPPASPSRDPPEAPPAGPAEAPPAPPPVRRALRVGRGVGSFRSPDFSRPVRVITTTVVAVRSSEPISHSPAWLVSHQGIQYTVYTCVLIVIVLAVRRCAAWSSALTTHKHSRKKEDENHGNRGKACAFVVLGHPTINGVHPHGFGWQTY